MEPITVTEILAYINDMQAEAEDTGEVFELVERLSNVRRMIANLGTAQ